MSLLFQVFNFDEKIIDKLSDEEIEKFLEAEKNLKKKLKERDIIFLSGNVLYRTVPLSIMIGKKSNGKTRPYNPKGDFYNIAQELGLPFEPGCYYIEFK